MAVLDRYQAGKVALLADGSVPGGVTFAFTERTGGVSEGCYASLNLGDACGDEPSRVAENRRLALAAIGAAVSLAMKNTSAQIALDVVVGLLGVAIACAPGNFLALCMMATMRCHTIMRPFAIVMGIALLVAAIVDVVMVRRAQAGTSRRPVNR